MEDSAFSALVTALATGLLVLVGLAQVVVLVAQRRQQRLDLAETYRVRWAECRKDWAAVVFVGRRLGDFYQVADEITIKQLHLKVSEARSNGRDVWAIDAVRAVSTLLSDVSLRILQGELRVSDVYPIFGTELLRHSKPVRALLESDSHLDPYGRIGPSPEEQKHDGVRGSMQEWLIYHDGIRRRCLILVDLLWAEAARLEDLPPSDLKSAADAKKATGKRNRVRVLREFVRLNGLSASIRGIRLAGFLRHAEYRRYRWQVGIVPKRLEQLDQEWSERLLGRHHWVD